MLTIVGGSRDDGDPPPGAAPTEVPRSQSERARRQALLAAPAVADRGDGRSPGDNFWDLAEGQLTERVGASPDRRRGRPALAGAGRDQPTVPGAARRPGPDLPRSGLLGADPAARSRGSQGLVRRCRPRRTGAGRSSAEAAPDCDPPRWRPPRRRRRVADDDGADRRRRASDDAGRRRRPDRPDGSRLRPGRRRRRPSRLATTGPAGPSRPTAPAAATSGPERLRDRRRPPDARPRGGPSRDRRRGRGRGRLGLARADRPGRRRASRRRGALVLLERRRRAQQRHRRPGRVVPPPPAPLHASTSASCGGAPTSTGPGCSTWRVRAAAAGAGATGLPPLRVGRGRAATWSCSSSADPSPAPPGFVALDRRPVGDGGRADELAAAGVPRGAAGSRRWCRSGRATQGTEVLVDLETARCRDRRTPARDVAEASCGRSSSLLPRRSGANRSRVVTVGLEPLLDRAAGRRRPSRRWREALTLAEDHADRIAAALRSLRCPTLAQARAVGATPEAWDPLVVVADVAPRDRDERRRLAALAGRRNAARRARRASRRSSDLAAGRRVRIGDHGWLAIDGVDEPVRPRPARCRRGRGRRRPARPAAQRVDVPAGEMVAVAGAAPTAAAAWPTPAAGARGPACDAPIRCRPTTRRRAWTTRSEPHRADGADDPPTDTPRTRRGRSRRSRHRPAPVGHDLGGAPPATPGAAAAARRAARRRRRAGASARRGRQPCASTAEGEERAGPHAAAGARGDRLPGAARVGRRPRGPRDQPVPERRQRGQDVYNTVSAARALVGERPVPAPRGPAATSCRRRSSPTTACSASWSPRPTRSRTPRRPPTCCTEALGPRAGRAVHRGGPRLRVGRPAPRDDRGPGGRRGRGAGRGAAGDRATGVPPSGPPARGSAPSRATSACTAC